MPATINMSKADLLKEHKKLIKILEHGNRKAQVAEAMKQKVEMTKYFPEKKK